MSSSAPAVRRRLIDIANGFRLTLDGTGAGIQLFAEGSRRYHPYHAFGGFLTLGVLIAVMQYALKKSAKKKQLVEEAAKEDEDNAYQYYFILPWQRSLINNFIFSQFLGCCPFLGCSNKVDTAVGMGLAVTFVMGLASAICWVIDQFVLVPLGLAFLQTLTFYSGHRRSGAVRRNVLKKMVPSLYSALGIYLPLSPPTARFSASFC